MNPKIDELLKLLAAKGVSEDEITQIRDNLLNGVYEQFMLQALDFLSDEDMQKIDACPTQDEANQMLVTLYNEKSGKDMKAEMDKIVEEKAQELITQYQTPNLTQNTDPTQQAPEASAQPAPSPDTSAADDQEIKKAEEELKKISEETPQTSEDPTAAANPSNWQ